jgi:hypothetical protein
LERTDLFILGKEWTVMLTTGTRVRMTKGYRGAEGTIVLKTDSKFELYIISLDSGLRIVAGPSAFVPSVA